MSALRLVLRDAAGAESAVVSARTLPAVVATLDLFAAGAEAPTLSALFCHLEARFDAGFPALFASNRDPQPSLEPVGDGLVVVDLAARTVWSFQDYLGLARGGEACAHDGAAADPGRRFPWRFPPGWRLIEPATACAGSPPGGGASA